MGLTKKVADSINGNLIPTLRYFGNWGFAGAFAFLLFQAMRSDQASQFTIYEREAEKRTTAIEKACDAMQTTATNVIANKDLDIQQMVVLAELSRQQAISNEALTKLLLASGKQSASKQPAPMKPIP